LNKVARFFYKTLHYEKNSPLMIHRRFDIKIIGDQQKMI